MLNQFRQSKANSADAEESKSLADSSKQLVDEALPTQSSNVQLDQELRLGMTSEAHNKHRHSKEHTEVQTSDETRKLLDEADKVLSQYKANEEKAANETK